MVKGRLSKCSSRKPSYSILSHSFKWRINRRIAEHDTQEDHAWEFIQIGSRDWKRSHVLDSRLPSENWQLAYSCVIEQNARARRRRRPRISARIGLGNSGWRRIKLSGFGSQPVFQNHLDNRSARLRVSWTINNVTDKLKNLPAKLINTDVQTSSFPGPPDTSERFAAPLPIPFQSKSPDNPTLCLRSLLARVSGFDSMDAERCVAGFVEGGNRKTRVTIESGRAKTDDVHFSNLKFFWVYNTSKELI